MSSYNVYIEEISSSELGDFICCNLIDEETGLTESVDFEKDGSVYIPYAMPYDDEPYVMLAENLAEIINEKLAAGEKLIDRYDNNYQPFAVGI